LAPVQLDLAVELGSVEDGAADDVGSYGSSACLTAAMLVTAPPMPTTASVAPGRRAAKGRWLSPRSPRRVSLARRPRRARTPPCNGPHRRAR
jgi:hypothetical protein